MRYLVTGMTGFAAPHLARLLLEQGHSVAGIIRGGNGRQYDLLDVLSPAEIDAIAWHVCDLRDVARVSELVADIQPDGVFHLAAQSHPPTSFRDPVMTWADNVTATVALVQAVSAWSAECHFMFCSTSEVYGDQSGVLDEASELVPCNPYGCSKAAMDLYVQERMRNGALRGFVTRAFSHTGPRRGRTFSISSDAYQIAAIEAGELMRDYIEVGNLDTSRAVMDVRDCVRAYAMLMEQRQVGVFCIAADMLHPMRYFTDSLIGLSTKRLGTEVNPAFVRKVDIQTQQADTTRVRAATGWRPEIDIDTTLRDLLDYWRRKVRE